MHLVEVINSFISTSCQNTIPGYESMYGTSSIIKQGFYFEPVIFETKKKIKLSPSIYNVTSYMDFTLYLKSSLQFHKFILFKRDMSDPSHVGKLPNTIRYT